MEHLAIFFILLLFLGFGLVSRRLEGSILTPPMLFTGVGLVFGSIVFGTREFHIEHEAIKFLLETTLILVLFSDAARINLNSLKSDYTLPMRMLLWGMPLTIILGTSILFALPVELTICELMLVAAILTPTDAALGQVVVSSDAVPGRIRQTLSVESGLNDGIALPLVLVFASIASALATNEDAHWIRFALLQLGFGPLAGIAIGYLGAKLLDYADSRGWVSTAGQGVMSLVLAGMCYVGAELVHGNGFIAAFTGGLVFGNTLNRSCDYLFEFVETEGQLLTLGTFFIFGALFLPNAIASATPVYWLVGFLALTLMRMLPVWISLSNLGLTRDTRLFLGWFGPRGLASILFISLVIGETALPNPDTVITIVFLTVFMSIFLHGVTAAPFARIYGSRHIASQEQVSS